jgi:HK97 family phage portal protein
MNIFNTIKSLISSSKKSYSLPFFTESGTFSKKQALYQYRRYIYTIVSAIAEDVAKINFQVYKSLKDGRMMTKNHPFIQLIRNPNPDYTKFSLIELHQLYMELCGESFWYIVRGENTKKPKHIVLLRPDKMEVAYGKNDKNPNPLGFVIGYVMTNDDGTKTAFNRSEIIHFKTPNPANPYRGLSPIEASVEYVKTEKLTSEFVMNSINNSGRPSGVLNIKGAIGQEEFEQVKKNFKQSYSGTANAGKTMLINGSDGVDFVKLGMELGELALKDLKNMSRDDLMIMYRVSKTMMGISDDVNRASAKEAKSVWIENVIKPKMERLCDGLDGFVASEYGADYDLSYQDPAPQYIEDKIKEWEVGHNKWLSTNDIIRERNEFFGFENEEKDGGDEMYQPISMVSVGAKPTEAKKEKSCDCGHDHVEPKKKDLTRVELGDVFIKQLYDNQTQWQSKYVNGLKVITDEQKNEILGRGKKVFEEWTFNPSDYNQQYRQLFLEIGVELMKQQGQLALDIAGDRETAFQITPDVLKYINDRVDQFTLGFDRETIDKIKDSIADGYSKGESISKLRKRLQMIYGEDMLARILRIARTESIASSNEAALQAYRQSPMVGGMEWYTEKGACPFCLELSGKIVGLNTNFYDLGQTAIANDENGNPITFVIDYTAINHPPLHPNCKCTILPVSRDNMVKMLEIEVNEKSKEIEAKAKENDDTIAEIEKQKKETENQKALIEKEAKKLEKEKAKFLKDLTKKRNEKRKEIFE